jgi:hypothetical protein
MGPSVTVWQDARDAKRQRNHHHHEQGCPASRTMFLSVTSISSLVSSPYIAPGSSSPAIRRLGASCFWRRQGLTSSPNPRPFVFYASSTRYYVSATVRVFVSYVVRSKGVACGLLQMAESTINTQLARPTVARSLCILDVPVHIIWRPFVYADGALCVRMAMLSVRSRSLERRGGGGGGDWRGRRSSL